MNGSQFKPAWWLRNSHLQTLWPVLCRRHLKYLRLERERFNLSDGDFVDLDWIGKEKEGRPIVMILHGFEGSIESHYAKSMLAVLYQQGWRAVFMHFRGCSGEPNRLARGYHSGETNDVAEVVHALRERYPDTSFAAIGYSLGGNVLLKWLGETGHKNPLTSAIAVSVPFELHKAAERIAKGFSRVYQWYFLKCLRQRLAQKGRFVATPINLNIVSAAQTIREFDEAYTAPLHGFASADEYYHLTSSRQFLRSIQIPTLVLHAKDDPFMTEEVVPATDELSPQVRLELSETGGHVGFVAGKYPWKPEYWLEKRIPDFLREYLPTAIPLPLSSH